MLFYYLYINNNILSIFNLFSCGVYLILSRTCNIPLFSILLSILNFIILSIDNLNNFGINLKFLDNSIIPLFPILLSLYIILYYQDINMLNLIHI